MTFTNRIFLLPVLLVATIAYGEIVEFSGMTPTEREDGTALGLSEIDGFRIYCGDTVGDYTDMTFIKGATLPESAWEIDKPAGTHYCVVSTLDIDGRESLYSNMVTVVVDAKALPKPPMVALNQIIRVVTTLP